jgi:D-alanyl-D-alanine carboxypeptidase
MMRRIIVLLIPVVLIVSAVLILTRLPKTEPAATPGDPSSPVSTAEGDATEPGGDSAEPTDAPTEPPTEPEPVPVSWNLLLINSQNEIAGDFEETLELDYVFGDFQADRRIIEFYTEMSNQAKQDGIELWVSSAYRSFERQTELFENRKAANLADGMSEDEAIAATLQYTNRPGTSEHHTGLALDIVTPSYQNLDAGYAETAAAKWLKENAAEYGFILRYPEGKESLTQVEFEPWHYRYVGTEAARIIMEKGYCLEEYFRYELGSELGASGDDAQEDEPADETLEDEPTADADEDSNDEPAE